MPISLTPFALLSEVIGVPKSSDKIASVCQWRDRPAKFFYILQINGHSTELLGISLIIFSSWKALKNCELRVLFSVLSLSDLL